jgi:hypothetical protein
MRRNASELFGVRIGRVFRGMVVWSIAGISGSRAIGGKSAGCVSSQQFRRNPFNPSSCFY